MPEPIGTQPRKKSVLAIIWPELLVSIVILIVIILNLGRIQRAFLRTGAGNESAKFVPPEEGTWRFIVSGDSRNCGDIVMPAIAAHGISHYQPYFYWHLGDLRAIYKIDEDMMAAAQKSGQPLSCDAYLKNAWPDFIQHQILPFGTTRFYVGIGNHEVIPPKTLDQFSSEFQEWLLTPRRQMMGSDAVEISKSEIESCKKVAARPYLLPTTYYHWVQGAVDFIFLDNSSGDFPAEELEWFDCTLQRAKTRDATRTVVVGMHEVLPHSMASSHGMCDEATKDPEKKKASCTSGETVYKALVDLQKTRNVYVLSSHSHFYMRGIFDNHPPAERLEGWIVGTAGAVRYKLPDGIHPGPDARTDVYGYLLGTVQTDGKINFEFQEVHSSDVPDAVRQQYPPTAVSWCFAKNSQVQQPSLETTNRCVPLAETTPPKPESRK